MLSWLLSLSGGETAETASGMFFFFFPPLLPISVGKLRVYFNPISFFNYGTAERVIPVV